MIIKRRVTAGDASFLFYNLLQQRSQDPDINA